MSVQADAAWAEANGLAASIEYNMLRLSGFVGFQAHYNGKQLLTGKSIPITVNLKMVIEDVWAINLTYDYAQDTGIPLVFDASGRIKETAYVSNTKLGDMHINLGGPMPKDSFCVAPNPELRTVYNSGFSLKHYFQHYLVPFLFQQSYYEKNQDWPWGNYPHGSYGESVWRWEQSKSNN